MERARVLSVRQRQAVDAVRAHYAEHGCPPSYKQIAARLGLVHPAQTDRLVKAAVVLGALQVVRVKGARAQIRLARPLEEVSTADLTAELAERAVLNKGEEPTLRLAA